MTINLLAFDWGQAVMWVLIIGALVAFWVFSKRSQQKREEEINKTLNAIQPGNKVKTIGGICGVVVEVCPEDNTFILETGSETSGKSYIKFDKKAVYQTDAVAPVSTPAVDSAPTADGQAQETPFEEGDALSADEQETAVEEKSENAEE